MGQPDSEVFDQRSQELRTDTQVEDIYQLLLRDHRSMRRLFDQLDAIPEEAPLVRQQVYFVLRKHILDHAEAEDEVVYARLAQSTDDAVLSMLPDARDQHALVEFILQEIDDLDPDDEVWSAKVTVLRNVIEQHLSEEEDVEMPAMRRELADHERVELAAIFLACKDELAEYED